GSRHGPSRVMGRHESPGSIVPGAPSVIGTRAPGLERAAMVGAGVPPRAPMLLDSRRRDPGGPGPAPGDAAPSQQEPTPIPMKPIARRRHPRRTRAACALLLAAAAWSPPAVAKPILFPPTPSGPAEWRDERDVAPFLAAWKADGLERARAMRTSAT